MTLACVNSGHIPVPTLARKRNLGAYYTPLRVTGTLCNWAIRKPSDLLLEPCFGGCTFLESSIERLGELGVVDPTNNLYGCDIDASAFKHLRAKAPKLRHYGNFYKRDYLALEPTDLPKMQAIIGNPPYVSLMRLNASKRAVVDRWERKYGRQIDRRSSLWAPITLHALSFLEMGGRLAWVLPGTFLTAKYSEAIRQEISEKFARVAYLMVAERLFLAEGTEERTVVLLADGFGENPSSAAVISKCLDSTEQLKTFTAGWDALDWPRSNEISDSVGPVPKRSATLVSKLRWPTLGKIADVEIGVVAGDSKFLIRSAENWRTVGVPTEHLRYIAPKSKWLHGLMLSKDDKAAHVKGGARCLALHAPSSTRHEPTQALLNSYPQEALETNRTFAKRDTWHRFIDDKVPDGFVVFMTHLGPRIIVNNIAANSSNGLYRLYVYGREKWRVNLLAIALQTTPTQVAAELMGHHRGSGALKLEPGDVKRLPVFLPKRTPSEIYAVFKQIDSLLRQNHFTAARNAADTFIFRNSPSIKEDLPKLREDLLTARKRRMRSAKELNDE